MAASPENARLLRLRALRVRANAAADAGAIFEAQARALQRDHRRLGNAADAWAAVCPADALPRTSIVGLARGVLTVAVPDAAAAYALDRALRAGAEAELIRRCSAPVRKVRVVVHSADEAPDAPPRAGG